MIAGAEISIFAVLIIARPIATKLMPLVRVAAAFYAAFFLLSYQFSTMFDDVRQVGNAMKKCSIERTRGHRLPGWGRLVSACLLLIDCQIVV